MGAIRHWAGTPRGEQRVALAQTPRNSHANTTARRKHAMRRENGEGRTGARRGAILRRQIHGNGQQPGARVRESEVVATSRTSGLDLD